MRSRLAPLALVPLLVAASAPVETARGAPEPDADIGVGIRLVDAPLARRDDPRAHVYIVDHLRPGDTIERRVEVANRSTRTRDVALYPAAATVGKEGFDFAVPNRATNELTGWVRLEKSVLTLKPDARARIKLTITVPESATAGEHYAVLWAEVEGERRPSANVVNVGRAGIRIYLSVGPGGEPPSDFVVDEMTGVRTESGDPLVTARVRNTGGRALDLRGELRLTDGPGALSVGPVAVQMETLAPGDTRQLRIPLDAVVPDGRWQARIVLASGRVQREATATITFGPTRLRSGFVEPTTAVTIGGVFALLVLVFFGAYAYHRRTR